jgi:peptide deformylase
MTIRDLVLYPNDVLIQPTIEVEATSEDTHALVQDLVDTMHNAKGVGLAAPQVGESKRVCIVEFEDELHVLVNPRILEWEGTPEADEEGCLSFPGVYTPVERSPKIRVKYQTPEGDDIDREVEGFLARAFQHEIDHLNGVLFIDRMSALRKRMALKKYRKFLNRRNK